MRILVIEDEIKLQNQIRQQLESLGYMVDTCSDGDEGLFLPMNIPWMLPSLILACPANQAWK